MASSAVEWRSELGSKRPKDAVCRNPPYFELEEITRGSNRERPFVSIIQCWLPCSGDLFLVGACPRDKGSIREESAIASPQSIVV
jgi:hypothetical protein